MNNRKGNNNRNFSQVPCRFAVHGGFSELELVTCKEAQSEVYERKCQDRRAVSKRVVEVVAVVENKTLYFLKSPRA